MRLSQHKICSGHDIAELFLKLVLNTNQSIITLDVQNIN